MSSNSVKFVTDKQLQQKIKKIENKINKVCCLQVGIGVDIVHPDIPHGH